VMSSDILEMAGRVLRGLRLVRDDRFGKLDYGILQVALMVAALDGDIAKAEVDTIGDLAKTCRGYSEATAAAAFDAALRSAGYLALLAKVGTRAKLLSAFLDEALLALPSGFLNGELSDVRRAFVMWTALAMSDGDYSDIEREAIRMLEKTWVDMKSALVGVPGTSVRMLPEGFLDRVEAALANGYESAVAELVDNG